MRPGKCPGTQPEEAAWVFPLAFCTHLGVCVCVCVPEWMGVCVCAPKEEIWRGAHLGLCKKCAPGACMCIHAPERMGGGGVHLASPDSATGHTRATFSQKQKCHSI